MSGPTEGEPDPAALQAAADAISWFHTIDLGHGVRTHGMSVQHLTAASFPPLAGRSVLDIGTWDGYHAFLAEREGASRVVALDHYVWGVDLGARQAYWDECATRGELPDLDRDTTDFWRPDLPGRRGFDFAREALGSSVEPVLADFMTTDLGALGTFDVVLYLGVLYHMREPLTALQRVHAVTASVAVVETEALHLEGLDELGLLLFDPGNAMNRDFGNWYVPTIGGLIALCRAAGFRRVDVVQGPPANQPVQLPGRIRRAAERLRQTGPAVPRIEHYRAVVHAYV